ncbi:AAA family ATPase (plasmid) [Salinirubellus salinus]|uniref:AAA family ATPase n=1 Tax=Salinirubellus salinus TaxID=1364945 RepID=A0A9E7UD33_9EURY|nr:AAA family ATPase [Salinirubellus salinus]UWM56972.1 AAA family ATPase [Salinirubellus salinus]
MSNDTSTSTTSSVLAPATLHERLQRAVGEAVVGQEAVVTQLTTALLAGGHVLLEGAPGVAKTTIATRVAAAAGLPAKRIQLTPDVLPADITGTQLYNEQEGAFEFRRGPVFSNAVIADEINRAMPKAQAALLEAMEEGRVSVDGETHSLPSPFFVVATQNPLDMAGTYPLPESQLDRFMFHLTVSAPSSDDALVDILTTADERERDDKRRRQASPYTLTPEAIHSARGLVNAIHVSAPIKQYLVALMRSLETDSRAAAAPSPRALIGVQRAAKARAAIERRAYVIPEDIKRVAIDALCHRLTIEQAPRGDTEAARELLGETLDATAVPTMVSAPASDTPLATDGGE